MLCRQLWGLLEPSLNKHTHTRRSPQENNKCPLTARRTKNGNSFLPPFCLLSRFREKLSLEGQPRSQRALAELCQGLCSESRRPFVSLQRDLCVSSLERELFPLATSDRTIGRKPASRSLRESIRKLAGLVGRKGDFSFSLRNSHSRPSGNVEVAA